MPVSMGEKVVSGQIIGYVGSSADIESLEETHLHFGVKKNGAWDDPMAYISVKEAGESGEADFTVE